MTCLALIGPPSVEREGIMSKQESLKWEFTGWYVPSPCGTRLHRIRAPCSFGDVEAEGLGGYLEDKASLSHSGNAWVEGQGAYRRKRHCLILSPSQERDDH
jgi:hypothetical protein